MSLLNYIKENYPELCSTNNQDNLIVNCGAECPAGWEPIVKKTIDHIAYYQKMNNYELVKTKFDNHPIYTVIYRYLGKLQQYFSCFTKYKKAHNLTRNFLSSDESNQSKLEFPITHKINQWILNQKSKISRNYPLYERVDNHPITILQIKEKLGTLRIYTSGGNSTYLDGVIGLAESLCASTCEITGTPGVLCVKKGWLKTLCEEERIKLGYEKC